MKNSENKISIRRNAGINSKEESLFAVQTKFEHILVDSKVQRYRSCQHIRNLYDHLIHNLLQRWLRQNHDPVEYYQWLSVQFAK